MEHVTNVLLQLHIQYVGIVKDTIADNNRMKMFLICTVKVTPPSRMNFRFAQPILKKAVIVCVFFQISSNARSGQNKAHSILKE